jgi:hypothetical protein
MKKKFFISFKALVINLLPRFFRHLLAVIRSAELRRMIVFQSWRIYLVLFVRNWYFFLFGNSFYWSALFYYCVRFRNWSKSFLNNFVFLKVTLYLFIPNLIFFFIFFRINNYNSFYRLTLNHILLAQPWCFSFLQYTLLLFRYLRHIFLFFFTFNFLLLFLSRLFWLLLFNYILSLFCFPRLLCFHFLSLNLSYFLISLIIIIKLLFFTLCFTVLA